MHCMLRKKYLTLAMYYDSIKTERNVDYTVDTMHKINQCNGVCFTKQGR